MAISTIRTAGLLCAGTAAAVCAGALAWTGQGDDPAAATVAGGWTCASPARLPPYAGFPQSPGTVQRWTDTRNETAARDHGWRLFAGLNAGQPGNTVWESWCTETQAFANANTGLADAVRPSHGERPMRTFKVANGPTEGSEPINFPVHPVYPIPAAVLNNPENPGVAACVQRASASSPIATLANGPQFQNNGDVMIAGVVYNDTAYNWIRSKQLYRYDTLQGMMPRPPQGQAMIPPMPYGSVALKPMLWPVAREGYTALPVWDDQKTDNNLYSGFEAQSQWPRAVAIHSPGGPHPQQVAVSFLNGVWQGDDKGRPVRPLPSNVYNAATTPLDRFYNYTPDLKTMAPCDRAILDASANYAYGRNFRQGDALALIAMHVMTKEQERWTFQSLWWSDRPDAGPYAAGRPTLTGVPNTWRNYLMTSTYGWTTQVGGNDWPIAYNPYIELAADHPIQTNCMNCHGRAAWPENGTGYLAPGTPGALEYYEPRDRTIFFGLLGVDSLWSIADRVPSEPAQPAGSRRRARR